jgi:hypothetical protein
MEFDGDSHWSSAIGPIVLQVLLEQIVREIPVLGGMRKDLMEMALGLPQKNAPLSNRTRTADREKTLI